MAALLSLPPELLNQIANELLPEIDFRDGNRVFGLNDDAYWDCIRSLSSLSQTCTVYRDIAQPRLYSRMVIDHGNWMQSIFCLLKYPRLAAQVNWLSLGTYGWEYDEKFNSDLGALRTYFEKYPEQHENIKKVMTLDSQSWEAIEASLSETSRGHIEINQGGILSAFTLALTRNVEQLLIQDPSAPDAIFVPNSFPHLRLLAYSHWDTEFGCDYSSVVSIVAAAPTLTTLYGTQVAGCSEPFHRHDGVQTLELDNISFPKDELLNLLCCLPNLRQLEYESGGASVSYEPEVSPRQFSRAITQHCLRLKDLRVDFFQSTDDAFDEEDDDEAAMEWDFSEVPTLQTLRIGGMCNHFEGSRREALAERLPASLRALHIDEYRPQKNLIPKILHLFGSETLPELKMISMSSRAFQQDERSVIEQACQARGIRCIFL